MPLTPQQTQPSPLLRAYVHGLQIDAQSREGGVVHLTVRADQQHKGFWRGFRQHIAHALFRAGDRCHPGHQHLPVRVVHGGMCTAAVNHGQPEVADSHIVDVWPLHAANGDAYYDALLIHEGVKRRHDGRAAPNHELREGGQKRTDDAHALTPLDPRILSQFTRVTFDPAGEAA